MLGAPTSAGKWRTNSSFSAWGILSFLPLGPSCWGTNRGSLTACPFRASSRASAAQRGNQVEKGP
eukprot:11213551-Lingulodinium_polyedra.AAC.1